MYVHTDDAEHGEANPQAVDHASRRDEPNADLLARIAVAAERFRGDIRAALAGFSEPSPKSAAVYGTLYRRIWGGTRLNDFATNKHAYYQARAGYIFGCRKDLQKVLAGFENSMAADHWEYAKELADRGRTLLRDLKQVPPDNDRERWREADYVGEYRQLAGDNPPAHPNTKRPGLSSLPPEWRSSIVKTAQDAGSKYTLAIAVQMVTGCRPIELCAGISVTPAANGALAFRIRGAKVQAGSQGQERRELLVPDDGRLELQLLKQSLQATGSSAASGEPPTLIVQVPNAKGLGWAVTYFGRAVSSKSHTISPYSARHQVASDLKAEGATAEERAAALGHLVTRTGQRYGRAAAGRASCRLTATAALAAKDTRGDPKARKRRTPKRK